MKGKEFASMVLQSISHPLRMTIMEKLATRPETFSAIMMLCGLDSGSSGLFNYHLSELIRSEIVEKYDEAYRLSNFGVTMLGALKAVESESSALLRRREGPLAERRFSVVETTRSGERLSAYDFFPKQPGQYVLYRMIDGYMGADCRLEAVLQHSTGDSLLLTLTGIGAPDDPSARFMDSSILYKVSEGKVAYHAGRPIGEQGWFWLPLSLPLTFRDGDAWQFGRIKCKASWVGNIKVGSKTYADCIRICVDNAQEEQVPFIRGEGEIYLSKGIGIIQYNFSRSSFDGDFSAEILEYGQLPRRTISGRILIIGEIPAIGYRVGIISYGKEDDITVNTDSQGRFSIQVFGHALRLRYSSLRTKGNISFEDERTRKIANITGDISGLELRFHEG